VAYDSSAPLERTLHSFALDLTGNPSLAQLLDQARGQKVEVALLPGISSGQPGTLTGSVLGVETRKQPVARDAVADVAMLNLSCADGLRSVKLAEVQRLRLLDPTLDGELRKALEALAKGHDAQKKGVSLRLRGEGLRRVRVGYVVEAPLWKASYRLVLGAEGHKQGQKPYLQGWAVVENATDEDWRDVRLALVSGRPISFRMDLYTPLYVPRPQVEPELFASLRPPAYSGAMDEGRRVAGRSVATYDYFAKQAAPGTPPAAGLGGFGGQSGKEANRPGQSLGLQLEGEQLGRKSRESAEEMQLRQGVSAAATASRLGDFFQYVLEQPVSLPRQKSALLPIVGAEVQAQRLSIYNEQVQPKFPLLGLRFKNTSGQHLMQGPLTLFEGSRYAGDSRLPDLQPNEERLLAYAVDLGTEVVPTSTSDSGRLTHVRVVKGILHSTTKLQESRDYALKNRNQEERTVLIEHPVRSEYKLVGTTKPAETARDFYRFEVKVPAGQSARLKVTEERQLSTEVQLASTAEEQLRWFVSQPAVGAKVKAALRRALELRQAWSESQRQVQQEEQELHAISEDQARLRANLKEVPATSAAYRRYVQKFDDQETQIEKLQAEVKKRREQEQRQRKDFEDFLANLSAE
jgi:hypothetical protein